jgi:hypothetical protein
MALEKNFSTRIDDLPALKKIAASLGYIQTRGKDKGDGSIRALLEAIARGEIIVTRRVRRGDTAIAKLAAEGVIEPADPAYRLAPFKPARLDGEPLSEMVIRERR